MKKLAIILALCLSTQCSNMIEDVKRTDNLQLIKRTNPDHKKNMATKDKPVLYTLSYSFYLNKVQKAQVQRIQKILSAFFRLYLDLKEVKFPQI